MPDEAKFTVQEFLQMPLNHALGLHTDTTLARLLELYAELRATYDPTEKARIPTSADAQRAIAKLMHRSPQEIAEQRRSHDFVLQLAARANCTIQELNQLRNFGLLPPTAQPVDPLAKFGD